MKAPKIRKRVRVFRRNKLVRREETLRKVLEGSEEGFWDWNIATGFVTRNDRWAQILGYSGIEEFSNDTAAWTKSIHPEDRERAWQSINDHLAGLTESHNIEYRMLTRDGGYIWIFDHAKVVERDGAGHPVRMSGTHRDITIRKELERERDDLVEKLRDLKGIISLCSNCHKLLDNEEIWLKIERYLEKHTDAQISHGICGECMEKLYGDKPWFNKKHR